MNTILLAALALFNSYCYNLMNSKQPKTLPLTVQNKLFPQDTTLKTGWYYIEDMPNDYFRHLDKSQKENDNYFITPTPFITAKNILSMEIYKGKDGILGLIMKFDKSGTKTWSQATGKYVGRRLAFIINNKLVHVAIVNSQITGGIAEIYRREYAKADLENFEKVIKKSN